MTRMPSERLRRYVNLSVYRHRDLKTLFVDTSNEVALWQHVRKELPAVAKTMAELRRQFYPLDELIAAYDRPVLSRLLHTVPVFAGMVQQ